MSNILITGGAGYIGSHTSLLLLDKGHKVIIFDSFINSSNKNIQRILSFIKGTNIENNLMIFKVDIRDYKSMEDIFNKLNNNNLRIDSVIHFAGLKDNNKSINNPINYWDNNVNGSINLFKLMEKFGCRNIVFSSSAAVYDISNGGNNLKESSNKKPITPYGETKLTIEMILEDIQRSQNTRWSIASLRYFNPIGAHHKGIVGEDPINFSTNIFPSIIEVACGERKEIEVYGSDWETKDGTGVRDYIHIMDLAEAHIAALEKIKNNNDILTLNIGTGIGTSVLDLINTFEKVNKIKIKKIFLKRRPGDFGKVIANNKLAIKKLDWTPKRSIEDMCRDGWLFRTLNR